MQVQKKIWVIFLISLLLLTEIESSWVQLRKLSLIPKPGKEALRSTSKSASLPAPNSDYDQGALTPLLLIFLIQWIWFNKLQKQRACSGWSTWRKMLSLGLCTRNWGCPGGFSDKEFSCSAEDAGWIPGWGRSPGEGNGSPLQYSCLENPMDRGAWQATVHRITKSQTQLTN